MTKTKKKQTKQQNNNLGLFILISVVLVIIAFIYAGSSGWFSLNQNYFINNSEYNINEALNQLGSSSQCTLDISPSTICQGDKLSGILVDGKNTNCYLFAKKDADWKLAYSGTTDDLGQWKKTETVDVLGKYYFRGACDKNANGVYDLEDCITNQEEVNVVTCNSGHQDGDVIDEIDEGINMGEGISEVFKPIDLGDFPYTDGEGCKLKALISTSWNYVDEEKCHNLQALEGMHFELWDSEKKVWERTDASPIALGSETYCGLQWDGTPWTFKAQKVLNIYQCQITLDYNIKIVTCDCP